MAKQPGSDWGSITSFGGKASSVFKGAGSGGARVSKNTNAVSKVIKPKDARLETNIIQKKSVKKVEDIRVVNVPEQSSKPKFSAKKIVAKRAMKLSEKTKRAIDKARLSEPSRFDWN